MIFFNNQEKSLSIKFPNLLVFWRRTWWKTLKKKLKKKERKNKYERWNGKCQVRKHLHFGSSAISVKLKLIKRNEHEERNECDSYTINAKLTSTQTNRMNGCGTRAKYENMMFERMTTGRKWVAKKHRKDKTKYDKAEATPRKSRRTGREAGRRCFYNDHCFNCRICDEWKMNKKVTDAVQEVVDRGSGKR